jgi:hypothetical protein
MIMRANEEMINWDNLKPILIELKDASINGEQGKIRKLLIQIVPLFKPSSHAVD